MQVTFINFMYKYVICNTVISHNIKQYSEGVYIMYIGVHIM